MGDRITVDLAVAPEFGAALIGVNAGQPWDREALIKEASAKVWKVKFDDGRLVAYAFPKLAMQFLDHGQ